MWLVLASVLGLWVLGMLCVPNFVRSGTSKTNAIINNLRQIDGAKQLWAIEHGRTGAVLVTTQDIAPYFRHDQAKEGFLKAVAGERYVIGTLVESPEAQLTREVDGRPKGTLLRLGTNGDELIICPTKGSSQ